MAHDLVHGIEQRLQALFGGGNAAGILALFAGGDQHAARLGGQADFAHELQNQRHAHELAVHHLLEIAGPGVGVHLHVDFVHPGQGVHHDHVRLGQAHFLLVQDIAVLEAQILLYAEKPLLLDAGHVQRVQIGQGFFQGFHFLIRYARFRQVSHDVARYPQFPR